MNNEWITDVLSDLRAYAKQQSMVELAEHLDDVILVASTQVKKSSDHQSNLISYGKKTRNISGALATGTNKG